MSFDTELVLGPNAMCSWIHSISSHGTDLFVDDDEDVWIAPVDRRAGFGDASRFSTEVFERYQRSDKFWWLSDEMYVQGFCRPKVKVRRLMRARLFGTRIS
ncbi:MAG: hypothetical protein DMG13_21005 [Acidobacteria bacterium]|nr:MAG: hypothetical protein DMG13_21005 [Acidobacteriota bacterium]